MAVIPFSRSLNRRIAERNVGYTVPAQINRSVWTGRSKILILPGVEIWNGSITFRPLVTEQEVRQCRALFAGLQGQGNTFDLPLTPTPQEAIFATVASGGAAGSRSFVITAPTMLGPEMVNNSDFENGLEGWSLYGDPSLLPGITWEAGKLVIDNTAGSGGDLEARGFLLTPTVAGKNYRYRAMVDLEQNPSGKVAQILNQPNAGVWSWNDSAPGLHQLDFTAAAPTGLEQPQLIQSKWTTTGGRTEYDFVSVRERITGANAMPRIGSMGTVDLPSGHKRAFVVTGFYANNMTVSINPSLPESLAAGAAVQFELPVARMRLSDPMFRYTDSMGTAGFSFDVEEAL